MSIGIIASNVPKDGESVIIDADNTNLMRLTRSCMERRLLSLPDQNAVTRLCQTSMNEDMDFSSNVHVAADEGGLAATITICSKSPNSTKNQVGLFLFQHS